MEVPFFQWKLVNFYSHGRNFHGSKLVTSVEVKLRFAFVLPCLVHCLSQLFLQSGTTATLQSLALFMLLYVMCSCRGRFCLCFLSFRILLGFLRLFSYLSILFLLFSSFLSLSFVFGTQMERDCTGSTTPPLHGWRPRE